MARQFTGIWPGVAILAAALCSAPHAPAQEESSGVRVLPSRRFYPPASGSEDTAAPQGPVRVMAKRTSENGTAPAAATPPATQAPTADAPKPAPAPAQPDAPDTPATDAPPSPEMSPPQEGEPAAPADAGEPEPKPADPAQEPVIPESPPLERFKPLWLSSPFSRNILPENKPAAEAAEYTLLGIGGLGEKWCALVLDKKSQPQRRLLLFDDVGDGQDRLVRVTESTSLDQVAAEVVINGAPYVVRYDITSLKAQVAAPSPGQPQVPAPAIKPAPGQPAIKPPTPPPAPVRVLPRRRYYPAPSNAR